MVKTTRICSYSRPILPPIASKKKQVRPWQTQINGDRETERNSIKKNLQETQRKEVKKIKQPKAIEHAQK